MIKLKPVLPFGRWNVREWELYIGTWRAGMIKQRGPSDFYATRLSGGPLIDFSSLGAAVIHLNRTLRGIPGCKFDPE